jgi:hypothetical protein
MTPVAAPEGAPSYSLDRMLDVIRSEFAEMAGARLSVAQCRRLFNLSALDCDRALDVLLRGGVLVRGPDGLIRDGSVAPVREAADALGRDRRPGPARQ